VRLIFGVPADDRPGAQVGRGDVLGLSDPLQSSAPDQPAAAAAAADLARLYAYPDSGPPRPWLRANMITSVDGAVSVNGRSGGLAGPADRLLFTVLRSLADVILVGAGTVRAEHYGQAKLSDAWPQLRAGRPATPPIAVLTRHLDLDLDGRLLPGRDDLARTIVLTTLAAPAQRRAAAAKFATVIVAGETEVTAAAAVAALADLGYRRILTEGGPTLLGQLTAAGLLDELCLTISPVLEGGQAARIIATPPGPATPGLTGLTLTSLIEDDGSLLCLYRRTASNP
jgi:riboflavin biosynthesis pyrimidine reductase